jgi:Uma2 family endonuclease
MSTAERVERLTLEEYARLYEQEGAFEIIDGERRPLMPPVVLHGLMIRALFRLLDAYCLAHDLGEVITEMPYVLLYDSNWVKGSRVPDLMFFAAARWRRYITETDDFEGKPFVLVPDLAVEVVSPNDLYTEIQDKVDHYLADGVRLVWVLDPQRKRITVYEGEHFTTLGEGKMLMGGDVIPGLSIPLADLFKSHTQEEP